MCAGQDSDFSLEDAVCAGKIINALDDVTETIIIPDDAAAAAMALDKSFGKNVLKMLKSSDHGKYLTDIGFADDLKLCAGTDSIPLLPVLSGNVIRIHKDASKVS
jgi:2-phosphosulfolactate phosphatase